ncbi:hypothetical protein ACLB2K_055165 [Fragaria x ananassa]
MPVKAAEEALRMLLPLLFVWSLALGTLTFCYAEQEDHPSEIRCLKSIKESLEDPLNSLGNWDFNKRTQGFICHFRGVECWHVDENKVLNLNLSRMGLKGNFPRGIVNCQSLVQLKLSHNHLSGQIPWNISDNM